MGNQQWHQDLTMAQILNEAKPNLSKKEDQQVIQSDDIQQGIENQQVIQSDDIQNAIENQQVIQSDDIQYGIIITSALWYKIRVYVQYKPKWKQHIQLLLKQLDVPNKYLVQVHTENFTSIEGAKAKQTVLLNRIKQNYYGYQSEYYEQSLFILYKYNNSYQDNLSDKINLQLDYLNQNNKNGIQLIQSNIKIKCIKLVEYKEIILLNESKNSKISSVCGIECSIKEFKLYNIQFLIKQIYIFRTNEGQIDRTIYAVYLKINNELYFEFFKRIREPESFYEECLKQIDINYYESFNEKLNQQNWQNQGEFIISPVQETEFKVILQKQRIIIQKNLLNIRFIDFSAQITLKQNDTQVKYVLQIQAFDKWVESGEDQNFDVLSLNLIRSLSEQSIPQLVNQDLFFNKFCQKNDYKLQSNRQIQLNQLQNNFKTGSVLSVKKKGELYYHSAIYLKLDQIAHIYFGDNQHKKKKARHFKIDTFENFLKDNNQVIEYRFAFSLLNEQQIKDRTIIQTEKEFVYELDKSNCDHWAFCAATGFEYYPQLQNILIYLGAKIGQVFGYDPNKS